MLHAFHIEAGVNKSGQQVLLSSKAGSEAISYEPSSVALRTSLMTALYPAVPWISPDHSNRGFPKRNDWFVILWKIIMLCNDLYDAR